MLLDFHRAPSTSLVIKKKELRGSQYRGCTVAYKENNVYNIYMKPRENKIDAMPLSGDTESGGCRLGSEPVRPVNPEVPGGARDPGVRGGAHDPMRDDVDGDEAMVPRVPNLPPEPSARQIAEHELTGHAVYRSWCRRRVERMRIPHERKESCLKLASIMTSLVVTKKMCCRSCVSSVGTVQLVVWEQQLLTGRERQIMRVHF